MTETFSAFKKGRPALFLFSTVTPLVIVLLLLPPPAATLECYSCNSFGNASCKSGDLTGHKMQCGAEYQGCRKWHFFFDAKGNGDIVDRLARGCAKTVKMNTCTRGFGASGKRFNRVVCECKTDNCNTAATAKVNLIMIGSVVLPSMMRLLCNYY